MQPADALLLAALRAAPRRWRIPPLPADTAAAWGASPDAALAFAIEAARQAAEAGRAPPQEIQALFTSALAKLVRQALAPVDGDPGFQATLLRACDPLVDEHARLHASQAADRRSVRSAVDAIAHPGKLRLLPPGPAHDALARLHALAAASDWRGLRQHAEAMQPVADPALQEPLQAIAEHPALARLERAQALLQHPRVQRYHALRAQRGPLAGSAAAASQGRASARLGRLAEQATEAAFQRIAQAMDRHVPPGRDAVHHRVVRSLRTPPGFPGALNKAKDEWDVALVRSLPGQDALALVLLAEVKAAPAAATPDFSRLLRGLQRLAQASPEAGYRFASGDGELLLSGASLRALQPPGRALPANVIYCCVAPPESQPQVLSAAARSVLLSEPASIDFARHLAAGGQPPHEALAPVWQALATAAHLRATLHQYETTRIARESMLDPHDLASF